LLVAISVASHRIAGTIKNIVSTHKPFVPCYNSCSIYSHQSKNHWTCRISKILSPIWAYCSPNAGFDYKGRVCKHPCKLSKDKTYSWCRLKNSKSWGYCSMTPADGTGVIAADKTECCYTGIGQNYKGRDNIASNGLLCKPWKSTYFSGKKYLPYVEENYCRNPSKIEIPTTTTNRPWCYTAWGWSYCTVPKCEKSAKGRCEDKDYSNGVDDVKSRHCKEWKTYTKNWYWVSATEEKTRSLGVKTKQKCEQKCKEDKRCNKWNFQIKKIKKRLLGAQKYYYCYLFTIKMGK